MSNFRPLFYGVVVCFAAFASALAAHAETIVQQRVGATTRLIPLKKITVGPDDQYHGTLDPSGATVVFTHKSDLVAHLRSQNLKSGEVNNLMPLIADSQEPSFSPDGRIAFTYYKFSARGDICYADLPSPSEKFVAENKIACLKAGPNSVEIERSNPFWKGKREIGYLVRDMKTQLTQIVSENIETGKKEILAEGKVWSPAMKTGGKYLVYNELFPGAGNGQRLLVLKDLNTMKTHLIHFSIPGISGFPSISDDEKYLYFSHYLDDTDNDNIIDGSDNAVIFRAPIAELLAAPEKSDVFPEQLTSVESSCSFPRSFKDRLYVTCAFEGELDVYEMPTTGIVPTTWTEAVLENAIQTSRTYPERVLLLNSIKYRFRPKGTHDLRLDERILSDHLLADYTSAATYYLDELEGEAKGPKKNFYALLRLYLQGREEKKVQPSDNEITREFKDDLGSLDRKAAAVSSQPSFQSIVRGLLRSFAGETKPALEYFKKADLSPAWKAEPLERYFYFELAQWVLPRVKASRELVQAYRAMMSAPELNEESQVFYAYKMLDYFQSQSGAGRIGQRIKMIQDELQGLSPPVRTLLQSEITVLQIIDADPKLKPGSAGSKDKIYSELDHWMSVTRDDYFLRRALYVRAILNFTDAGEFKFLNNVAVNWLRYTKNSDTEFISAREIYSGAQLARAYDTLSDSKNLLLASGYFYGSLSLTDDLESHSGYILREVQRGDRAKLDRDYDILKKRKNIDDNMKFVQALLNVIDSNSLRSSGDKSLDKSIGLLEDMDQDHDSPVRYLLLGYCYLEKMLGTADGYEVNSELFQNANRSLMLAYDLGRENERIKASALVDLGIMHQRVENHGLAAKFFSLRMKQGFLSLEEQARLSWLYAKSLYFNHQPDQAAEAITAVLNAAQGGANAGNMGSLPSNYLPPLLERKAFYLEMAGNYKEADLLYRSLTEDGKITGDLNLAKANLSFGYGLFKLKQDIECIKVLEDALRYIDRLKLIQKNKERKIAFEPLRLQLVAYGLLSQIGSNQSRADALEKRALLLPEAQGLLDEWLPTVIQNRLQSAALYSNKEPERALQKMKEALRFANQLGATNLFLGNAVFQTAVDYLAHGILYPKLYAGEDPAPIRKFVDDCIHALNTQKRPQPILDFKKLKLEMLWHSYSVRVLQQAPDSFSFQSDPQAAELKDALPELWKQLSNLDGALKAS